MAHISMHPPSHSLVQVRSAIRTEWYVSMKKAHSYDLLGRQLNHLFISFNFAIEWGRQGNHLDHMEIRLFHFIK